MQVKAKIKNLKISPKKVRLIADLVRGKEVNIALNQLKFTNKKSARPISELIKSAIANAEHNFKLDKNNLFIKEIKVDKGLTLKRYIPRAQGRATPLLKKMSHVNLILDEIKPSKEKKGAKPKKGDTIKVDSKKKINGKDIDAPKITKSAVKPKDIAIDKGSEIKDPRMEGKHRHQQHADKTSMKAKGGSQKKTSVARKSG